MLILRGAPALSAFRHGKLLEQLTQHVPAVTGLYAEFAHFADVTGTLGPYFSSRASTCSSSAVSAPV
ncbi:hypothetical protein, partial [Pseudomonas aeruginosa]